MAHASKSRAKQDYGMAFKIFQPKFFSEPKSISSFPAEGSPPSLTGYIYSYLQTFSNSFASLSSFSKKTQCIEKNAEFRLMDIWL